MMGKNVVSGVPRKEALRDPEVRLGIFSCSAKGMDLDFEKAKQNMMKHFPLFKVIKLNLRYFVRTRIITDAMENKQKISSLACVVFSK